MIPPAAGPPPRESGRWTRSFAATLLLGFSSGLPLALTGDALLAWLSDHGMKLADIGAFSAVGLPYVFKFLWAPFFDLVPAPFLDRRRGWIVVCQVLTAAAVLAMAACGDSLGTSPWPLAIAATTVAFASASQDVVIDAWRAESFPEKAAAGAASVHVTGYRAAMLATGAGTLLLHGQGWSWPSVYAASAAALAIGLAGAAIAAAPPAARTRGAAPQTAVYGPLVEILSRRGSVVILAFVLLFRLPDVVAGLLVVPFLKSEGFSGDEIAAVRQGLGLFVTIGGTVVGGLVAAAVGLRRALVVYGILQAVSNLAFWWLARQGHDLGALAAAVVVENFCGGLVTAGFLGFLQRQCSPGMAATQFALLTSLAALPGRVFGGLIGASAQAVGWPAFFAGSALLGLPGLLLLPLLRDGGPIRGLDAPAPVPADDPSV